MQHLFWYYIKMIRLVQNDFSSTSKNNIYFRFKNHFSHSKNWLTCHSLYVAKNQIIFESWCLVSDAFIEREYGDTVRNFYALTKFINWKFPNFIKKKKAMVRTYSRRMKEVVKSSIFNIFQSFTTYWKYLPLFFLRLKYSGPNVSLDSRVFSLHTWSRNFLF